MAELDSSVVDTAVEKIHAIIDNGIDQMKSSRDPVPVVLVGGGAVLVTKSLATASEIHRPEHSGVANAIGAATIQYQATPAQTDRLDVRPDEFAARRQSPDKSR